MDEKNWSAIPALYPKQVARDPDEWRFLIYGKIKDHDDACFLDLMARNSKEILDALDALRAENARLAAKLADALETLEPFERMSLPGYDATSTRPVTVTVTEGDLCQAWQMMANGKRWRPTPATLEASSRE